MHLNNLTRNVQRVLRDNSSTILTAFGVSGVLTTAYLTAKASFKASEMFRDDPRGVTVCGKFYQDPLTPKEKVELVWKLYIPAGISGALTIGCIISGTRVGMRRTAAAYSLLTVSEKAFSEYRDKVIDQVGEKKEQALRDEIAQDRVTQSSQGVIVIGSGNVLCYEMHTGRYFNSDMETLRKAQNNINAKLISEMEASLSDFYYLVGLPYTSHSSGTGWSSDKMLELSFSTVLSEDGRPCISFEYNYVKPL